MSASGPSHTHKHRCTRDAHTQTHALLPVRTHRSTPDTNHDETAKQRVDGNNDRRPYVFSSLQRMSCRPGGAADGTELSPQSQKVLGSFSCSPRVCASTCGLKTGRGSQVGVCCLSLHVRPELATCPRCIPPLLNTTAGLNSRHPPHCAG